MYIERSHKIDDRFISFFQPHVQPIVRGKAKNNVEFGANIFVSFVDGFYFPDRVSWDAYLEASDLPIQIEKHKQRFGFYPAVVITDGIYGT